MSSTLSPPRMKGVTSCLFIQQSSGTTSTADRVVIQWNIETYSRQSSRRERNKSGLQQNSNPRTIKQLSSLFSTNFQTLNTIRLIIGWHKRITRQSMTSLWHHYDIILTNDKIKCMVNLKSLTSAFANQSLSPSEKTRFVLS